MSRPAMPPGTMPVSKEQERIAERRKQLPYNAQVHDEQRFGTSLRTQLKSMFYSGGNVGVGMPRQVTSDEAGDRAAAFYREHVGEFDVLYKQGYGASDAARIIGKKHGVRFF